MSATQTRKLQAAYELLNTICNDVSDTMPVRQALAFVAVAIRATRDGYADLREIAEDTGANSAVASRDLLVLGEHGRGAGKPGYDLVAVDMGAIRATAPGGRPDLRRRPYVLTKKGKAVVAKLVESV